MPNYSAELCLEVSILFYVHLASLATGIPSSCHSPFISVKKAAINLTQNLKGSFMLTGIGISHCWNTDKESFWQFSEATCSQLGVTVVPS